MVKFLAHVRGLRHYSPHTLRAYEADLGFFIARLGDIPAEALDRSHIRAYLSELSSLMRSSLLRRVSAVRSFARYLRQQGVLQKDPFLNLRLPRREARLPKFLTEAEVEGILGQGGAEPWRLRDRALIELLYSSGLRRSELSGLNVGDVDFVSGLVRVFGKGSRERLVPTGDRALACLREYLARRRSPNGGDPLFLNGRGQRLSGQGVAWAVRRWIDSARGLKPVTPHVFRHCFATHLLNKGCDLRSIQEMLGHRSLATTQAYTHLSLERLKKVYRQAHPGACEGAP